MELDCWDGDGKEPIIYHGHTLTSRIFFGGEYLDLILYLCTVWCGVVCVERERVYIVNGGVRASLSVYISSNGSCKTMEPA